MAFARILAQKMGCPRAIKYGRDGEANAWTNGVDEIYLTDSAWSSGKFAAWAHQTFRIICHEWAHDTDSRGSMTHDGDFCREYRELTDRYEATYVSMVEEVDDNGLFDTFARYDEHPDDW
jgi:hypothetical protein